MPNMRQLFGSTSPKSYARDPVWSESTTKPIRWIGISKKRASKIWHQARLWDRSTRSKNRHGGIIGRSALSVLYALIWDCLSWKSGRLDPSIDRIAELASLGRTATIDALKRLKSLHIIDWIRRCEGYTDEDGRYRLRQLTNAYGISEPGAWPRPKPAEPPPPHPQELGFPTPIPTPLEAAICNLSTPTAASTYALLMADQSDRLAVALAQLGRAMGSI
jgi:hypothetical protein